MRMFILSLLCVNLLVASAEHTRYNGHFHTCKTKKDLCKDESDDLASNPEKRKYLFYDVNPPEGFNLRRDVYMRFAILLSEAQRHNEKKNWQLVLPPWYFLYHWRSASHRDPPRPWSVFFDVPSLGSYIPVIELQDLMQDTGKYGLRIDTLYVLQHFDDPFDDGEFKDKWNIVGPCKYDGHFWGYNNITAKDTICVQYQGSIIYLLDIMDLEPEDKKVMFAHGEIPLHLTYGTKQYWDCRKSMLFNEDLVAAADSYIVKKLNCHKTKCSNYLAVHWRRQDFLRSNRSTSIKGTAEQINKAITRRSLYIKAVFIASDGSTAEIKHLQDEIKAFGYTAHVYVPDVKKYLDGQVAIIDQIICSRSAHFIGTHESTFTYRIQEEREILGFDSNSTFNRLCPDVGECEKPSRWTIVH